jgi:hypothetical protein
MLSDRLNNDIFSNSGYSGTAARAASSNFKNSRNFDSKFLPESYLGSSKKTKIPTEYPIHILKNDRYNIFNGHNFTGDQI